MAARQALRSDFIDIPASAAACTHHVLARIATDYAEIHPTTTTTSGLSLIEMQREKDQQHCGTDTCSTEVWPTTVSFDSVHQRLQ